MLLLLLLGVHNRVFCVSAEWGALAAEVQLYGGEAGAVVLLTRLL